MDEIHPCFWHYAKIKGRTTACASLSCGVCIRLELLSALSDDVEINSCQDDNTFNNILPEGVNVQQVKAVGHKLDNQDTNHYAAEFTNTAQEGDAAQNGSRDGVHLSALSCTRLARVHTSRQNDTSDGGEDTGQGVNDDLNLLNADTRESCSLFVTTNGIQVTAKFRLA